MSEAVRLGKLEFGLREVNQAHFYAAVEQNAYPLELRLQMDGGTFAFDESAISFVRVERKSSCCHEWGGVALKPYRHRADWSQFCHCGLSWTGAAAQLRVRDSIPWKGIGGPAEHRHDSEAEATFTQWCTEEMGIFEGILAASWLLPELPLLVKEFKSKAMEAWKAMTF